MIRKAINKYQSLPLQVRASFWFLVCSFIQKAISAITTPVFTRLLTNAEFGQFNVYLSWQSILRVLITLNLYYGLFTSGLVKFKERRAEYISAFEGITLVLVLSWSAVYLGFRSFFNQLFSLTTPQMICMMVTFWTTAVYSFWAAEQRVDYEYRKLVIVTMLAAIAKPLLGVILVINSTDKVTARILGVTIVEVVGFSWIFFYHIKKYRKLFSAFFWKYALRYNIPLIPHYLAENVLINSDRIMIERMVSSESSGIYSLAYSVSLIMNLFNTALIQTISPWVYGKIKERKEKEIDAIMTPSVVVIAAVNLLLIALGPEIVRVFAPGSYYEAIWIIPPVVMSVYFTYVYQLFSYYEFYFEKTSFIALATMISAGINVVLNYVFIQIFGYIAAGYTTLICYIFYAIGHYLVMRKIAKDYLDNNEVLSKKKLLAITGIFMGLGFAFCALYRHMTIRYMFLGTLIIVMILLRRKIMKFLKDILNIRKAKA